MAFQLHTVIQLPNFFTSSGVKLSELPGLFLKCNPNLSPSEQLTIRWIATLWKPCSGNPPGFPRPQEQWSEAFKAAVAPVAVGPVENSQSSLVCHSVMS